MSDNVKVETPGEKQKRLFHEFIQKKFVMIVDSQASSRIAMANTLSEMGCPNNQIKIISSYFEAEAMIESRCPDILITEYDLEGGRCGLDLLQTLRKTNKNAKDSLFILVTENTSQAAVARAAEEDVDGYILKPYTLDGMRSTVMRIALAKTYPSQYIQTIEKGKKALSAKKTEEADQLFTQALKLDPKPSLAHFYNAQVDVIQKILKEAEGDYNKGLSYNKIHYKCLTGLFDLFMDQKNHKEAYDVVRRIARYFPANPERLATVLRLAVMNSAYEDIERYYQLFCKLDQRNEELIRYVCAALVVCGKYYLQYKVPYRAVELFNKATATSKRRPYILKEVILSLAKYDLVAEAESFLHKYPVEAQNTPDYYTLKYVVTARLHPAGVAIQMGHDLIRQGIREPLLYRTLIEKLVENKFNEEAESLVYDALKIWPDMKEELEALLNPEANTSKKKIA